MLDAGLVSRFYFTDSEDSDLHFLSPLDTAWKLLLINLNVQIVPRDQAFNDAFRTIVWDFFSLFQPVI